MADMPKFGYPRRIDIVDAVNEMISAYCKVETDGSIYINPVTTSGAGCTWVGTFTYLI